MIKKFEQFSSNKLNFDEAKEWILTNYPENRLTELFDEEVSNGNWIDQDQMEEEGYETEHEYYVDYGHGEAEDEVMSNIINDLKSKFSLDFDPMGDDTDLYDFIKDEYPFLSH